MPPEVEDNDLLKLNAGGVADMNRVKDRDRRDDNADVTQYSILRQSRRKGAN